ncbi:MAG: D-inositol-3-phosphate glycosyltransferase [Flavobacteriales bacterium]|nr:D-inositol-3-phosphate glycosyltransferase [Flavobacteriales bacterium]
MTEGNRSDADLWTNGLVIRMRILKIIHGYPPLYNAGSEVYSQSICNELAKRHEVLVFTREEDPFTADFTFRRVQDGVGPERILVNMPRGKDGYRHRELDERFAEVLHGFRPDVAHIGHLNHLSTGIVDVLKEAGIPIVFTLHDFWLMCPRGQFLQRNFGGGMVHALCDGQDDRKCALSCYAALISGTEDDQEREIAHWTAWIHRRMIEARRICEQVDRFIAPSLYLRDRFIRDLGIAADKVQYLDYGFPLHYLTPSLERTQANKYRFGYIGTHIPAKGVNLLIEAFDGLEKLAELHVWGAKDEQSTRALMSMAEGRNGIHFHGSYVNQNLANSVFSQVDCIVVPSIWMENSPLVIHEAQACHIPVITADAGGMAELVAHQVNGLLFEHRSADSLGHWMRWAIQHPGSMDRLGRRGYLHSADGAIPSIEEHCKTLEDIYTQLKQTT